VLAISAILNVLMAWGCLLWSSTTSTPNSKAYSKDIATHLRWLTDDPDGILNLGFGVLIEDPSPPSGPRGIAQVYTGGWPILSMQSVVRWQIAPDGRYLGGLELPAGEILSRGMQTAWLPSWLHISENRRLPIEPIWSGFLIDTLFYFCLLSVGLFAYRNTRLRTPNQSPEPTAVGACSSAIAVHAASRRWLSFFR
jgi:hypothetical protein